MTTISQAVTSDVSGYTKTVVLSGLHINQNMVNLNFEFNYTDAAGNKVIMPGNTNKSVQYMTYANADHLPKALADKSKADEVSIDAILTALSPAVLNIIATL